MFRQDKFISDDVTAIPGKPDRSGKGILSRLGIIYDLFCIIPTERIAPDGDGLTSRQMVFVEKVYQRVGLEFWRKRNF